jgi:small redox-active disulfide protein 2
MPQSDITQISLGKFKVGITGLKEALEEVRALTGRSDAEISQALLEKLKPKNYIPAPAQEEYKEAFLREYKKALGEKVTEERRGLIVKILGPGCPNCEALEQRVMAAVAELNLPAEVEHVRDRQEILSLGVFGTPALLINDEVKTAGQVPTKEMLKQWLRDMGPKKS